jgi:hypothetical protein
VLPSAFLVMLLGLGIVADGGLQPAGKQSPALDVATFTTQRFQNAPESLLRFVSAERRADGAVVVTTIARPCSSPQGTRYRFIVRRATVSSFERGELLMTGLAKVSGGGFWAVRRVDPSELSGWLRPEEAARCQR